MFYLTLPPGPKWQGNDMDTSHACWLLCHCRLFCMEGGQWHTNPSLSVSLMLRHTNGRAYGTPNASTDCQSGGNLCCHLFAEGLSEVLLRQHKWGRVTQWLVGESSSRKRCGVTVFDALVWVCFPLQWILYNVFMSLYPNHEFPIRLGCGNGHLSLDIFAISTSVQNIRSRRVAFCIT